MTRRRKMDPERKAFISSLLEHYQSKDARGIQDILKDLLGDTLQGMLEAEMDDHLGYSKYDYKNKETDDSRNGYSPKTVTSSMGTIDLDIPRAVSYTHLISLFSAGSFMSADRDFTRILQTNTARGNISHWRMP